MSEELKEKLFDKKENGWVSISEEEKQNIFNFSKGYMDFLNQAKTEREFVKMARRLADQNGYKDICQLLLDRESELAKTLTANGEDYRNLATKSNFAEWLNQRI